MPKPSLLMPSRIALPSLLVLASVLPAFPASAELDTSGASALAGARFQSQQTFAMATPSPGGGLDVTLSAIATDNVDLGPTFSGDFIYQASFLSTGFLDYGFASANIDAMAQSTPALVDSIPPGSPAGNEDHSVIDGAMDLRFTDLGVVTGGAPETLVTLTLKLVVQSAPVATGEQPSYEHWAKASMHVRVIDQAIGGSSIDRDAYGSEVVTAVFDTKVGHQLSIEGRFRAEAKGTVGPGVGGFFPQYLVSMPNSIGGFWMEPPAGVGFVADSTTDYTVPVPEPSRTLLALVGAGLLAATTRARVARPGAA